MKKLLSVILTIVMILGICPVGAIGISEENDGFKLFENETAADLYVSDADYSQVARAMGDLQADVMRVTEVTPVIKNDPAELSQYSIIVGSIEQSPIINQLMEQGKLDEAKDIAGKFESFVIKTVDNPVAGVKKALVIAGSDKRGTIYGIYDLSAQIGVSPYYWWADVTPKVQNKIIISDDIKIEVEPSVKYRGIFINDEKNLTEWSAQFSDNNTPGVPNSRTYEKVFELLLRLKANTLWPAMHNYSNAFNLYEDAEGISINAKLADSYGIIMGASHCEMLLRNNEGEWSKWANENVGKYDAANAPVYDYTVNPKALEAYWRERVEKNKDFEGIYNIGMRGIHDSGMSFGGLSNPSLAQKIEVLQQVIDCQRKILSEVLGKPADQIPQAFIPYKEAAEYYNGNETTKGVQIPDDVILMWAEDNHGYVRQIPTEAERRRSGGSGIYYHVSYWGIKDTSYLWLNTTPLSLMYEELKKAYDTGAQKYWILNVGDIKPSEISLEFMMKLARDINSYDDTTINQYVEKIAQRDFLVDDNTAADIADIMTKYYQYNIAKRPEFQGYEASNGNEPYSIVSHGDEAQIRVDQLNALVAEAEDIYKELDSERRDAFYQMILYPLRSSANNLAMNVYWQKNQLYAQQGRFASVEKYQDLSVKAYNNLINDLTYYNKTMQNGKWDKIMNPYNGTIPVVVGMRSFASVTESDVESGIGAVCEGQQLPEDNVTLTFSSLGDNRRFIDIFNKEYDENSWTIEADEDFIVPSETSGNVSVEERIWIGIDWTKAEYGENSGTVTVKDQKGFMKTFNISAFKSAAELNGKIYVEENGVVAIEAEHYSESVAKNGSEWRVVKNLGRSGDSMKVYPEFAPRIDDGFDENAAQLKYNIYFKTTGTFTGTIYRIPTLNEGIENGVNKTCRIAVGMDGAAPQVLSGMNTCVDVNNTWKRNTLEQIEKLTFTIEVEHAGENTLVVYKSDASIAFDRIVINCGGEQTSYLGPAESYNTILYEKAPESLLPELSDGSQESGIIELYRSDIGLSEEIKVNDYINAEIGKYILLDAHVDVDWNIVSGDETVDLLVREDGKAVIAGNMIGEAVIKAESVSDPGKVRYCKVIVSGQLNSRPAEFLEQNGEVIINTTSALEQSKYAGFADSQTHYWQPNDEDNALTIQPDIGIKWKADAKASTVEYDSKFLNSYAPKLSFQIYFEHAGTYYVHTLSSHPIDASDSYHVGIDDKWQFHTNYAVHSGKMRWEKRDSGWYVTIESPGVHTLNIWAREDGIVPHRIYLTTTSGKNYFDGWGPEESSRRYIEVGDKTTLQNLINSNKYRAEDIYTQETWDAYADCYSAAKLILSDIYAEQEQVDRAYDRLAAAIAALQSVGFEDVIAAIAALPDLYSLSIADEYSILSAAQKYNSLSNSDKGKVNNSQKLLELERDLRILKSGDSGDLDRDGMRTVADVVALRRIIMDGIRLTAAMLQEADIDKSGDVSVVDVVGLRKEIMSQSNFND